MIAQPVIDHLPISLRAYAAPQFSEISEGQKFKRKRKASKVPASPWAVLFDTETTTDAGQALRFGTYQVRKAAELHEAGIFFDPEGVTAEELATLRVYAGEHGLELLSRDQFADQIFYRIGYLFRAAIIGFNLPFDISRIAIHHNSARTEMRGGFTFKISGKRYSRMFRCGIARPALPLFDLRPPCDNRMIAAPASAAASRPTERAIFSICGRWPERCSLDLSRSPACPNFWMFQTANWNLTTLRVRSPKR
jgi:hypothetical protein